MVLTATVKTGDAGEGTFNFERDRDVGPIIAYPGHGGRPLPPISVGKPGESPRIAAIQKNIQNGNVVAVDEFWREIKLKGTPLVEPISGDDAHVLATFLWRAEGEVKNVTVDFLGINDVAGNQMAQLPGTNVWFRTYVANKDLRISYLMVPNDPLVPLINQNAIEKELAAARQERKPCNDPLNPNTFVDDPPRPAFSSVALPGAEPHPYLVDIRQPGVPEGALKEFSIRSAILNQERKFWIYTPPGYRREAGPYAYLVHFDGRGYTAEFPLQIALDNLLAKGEIPPIVGVFVDQIDRVKELACNPRFVDFLADELTPWVKERYAIADDPLRTMVAGSSMGGLGAMYAAYHRPKRFGCVIALTGAFYCVPSDDEEGEWLARHFARSPKLPIRVFMDVGNLEPAWHLASNRHMRDVLVAKGYLLRYEEFTGVHCYYCRQGAFERALSLLIGKRKAELE